MTNHIEIHIICAATEATTIADHLEILGAQAITFEDALDHPVYERAPGETRILWQETKIKGLFNENVSLEEIIQYCETEKAKGTIKQIHTEKLPDQDWVRISLAHFKPLFYGERLCICPSWITPPDPNRVTVILDPGLSFGTGTHPTTALCLNWLATYMTPLSFVIDYGCGSGILGITAHQLGAQKVLAVDHDPQALIATRNNAAQNRIPSKALETVLPEAVPPSLAADLLMANILAGPLIELAHLLVNLVKPSGKILLSGILESQAFDIIEVYKNKCAFSPPELKEGWAFLVGTKINNELIE